MNKSSFTTKSLVLLLEKKKEFTLATDKKVLLNRKGGA